jgi:hypothetical protein
MDRPVLSAYLLWTIRFDRPIPENSPILPVYQLRTIRFDRPIPEDSRILPTYRSCTIRFDRPIPENSPILPVYQLRTIRFYRSIAQQTIRFQPLSLQRHRERSTIPQAKDVLPAFVASESPSKISMFSFVVIDIYS